jgi:cytochrome c-type biogenesis protein CcmH/NrfG
MARALLERASGRMTPAKRRAVEQAARGDEHWADVAWILARAAHEQVRPRRTLDARRRAARGALWHRLGRA